MRVKNKVIIVTGSSKGIGRAIAILLAENGAKIIVNHSNSENEANKTVEYIIKNGGTALAIQADVSQKKQVTNLFDKTIEAFGKVDVLINHAPFEPYLDAPHYSYLGCEYSKKYMLNNKIKTYICGHIHENYDYKNIDGIDCYNVAILNEKYEYVNKPTLIDI